MHVTAAIIFENERYLICQRGAGGSCAYLWEFPGGKVEPNEDPEACLIRECQEELGITIRLLRIYAETSYQYPERRIDFTFFEAHIESGSISPTVHEDVRWVSYQELHQYPFCPADVEIVKKLSVRE